jgi:hypothetical protein
MLRLSWRLVEFSASAKLHLESDLLVSSLAQTDALAKLLIEKGIITKGEFMSKGAEERAIFQKMFNPAQH